MPWSKKWPMVWGMVIHPVMKIHPHHGYLNPYQNGLMMTVPQYGYVYTCVYIYYIWLLVLSSHDPTFHHGIIGSGKVTCPKETWNGSETIKLLRNVISFGG